jgi:hypothetical protein
LTGGCGGRSTAGSSGLFGRLRLGLGHESAQWLQVGEAVEAGEQEAGVDGPGHGVGNRYGGDHRCAGHLRHVPASQAPASLDQQDDSGRRRCRVLHEGGERQVARTTQHGVAVVGDGRPVSGRSGAGVDHGGRACQRPGGEPQAGRGLYRLVGVVAGQPEEGGGVADVGHDQRGRPVAGGVDGKDGGDRSGALPALGPDQRDGVAHGRPTCTPTSGAPRRATDPASPTGCDRPPVTLPPVSPPVVAT